MKRKQRFVREAQAVAALNLAPIGSALRTSVTRDGKRFLLVTSGAAAESPLTVLLNWTSALKN